MDTNTSKTIRSQICNGAYNIIFHYGHVPESNVEKGIFYLYDSTEDEFQENWIGYLTEERRLA